MAAKPKGGLGKGLGSLFEESVSLSGPDSHHHIAPKDIEPDKNQPRKVFDPDSISQLAASILEHGILQPIAVRPAPAGGYRIIAGERRWRAARQAGLTEVPVVIREVTDEQAMELALIENLQREGFRPHRRSCWPISNSWNAVTLTQEQAAKRLSRSRSAIGQQFAVAEPSRLGSRATESWTAYHRSCKGTSFTGWSRTANQSSKRGYSVGG